MTEYKYAEPVDAAEASARIKHWLGDTGAFQAKLGLHDPGFDQEPYYPKFSGHRTENSKWDAMLAADMARYPDKWVEAAVPIPPLKDSWHVLLIRTRDDVLAFYKKWTSVELLKRQAREQIKKLWVKVTVKKQNLLKKLGEPEPSIHRAPVRRSHPASVINTFTGLPYDPDTYTKVQREIAEERAAAKDDKPSKFNDPKNDGTLFS